MCEGAYVCWFSRMQKCVKLSTSEAEYVALELGKNCEIVVILKTSVGFPAIRQGNAVFSNILRQSRRSATLAKPRVELIYEAH